MGSTTPLRSVHYNLDRLLRLSISRRLARLLALQGRYLVLKLQDLVLVVLVGLLYIILVLVHAFLKVSLILKITRLITQLLHV